jgi:hypothetical protein
VAAVFLLAAFILSWEQQPAAEWLPAGSEDVLVSQLVERLGQIKLDWTRERATNAARTSIAAMRAGLSRLSEADLATRAPALAALDLPSSRDARLDVMARYQMCVSSYYVRHERRASETSEDNKIAAIMGFSAGSLVLLYLRHGYIAAGGSEEELEKFLSGDQLEVVFQRMQRDTPLLQSVAAECAPVFGAIIQG